MSVAVGFVHPGTVSTHFALSLYRTIGVDRDLILDERSGPNVARARNRVVERFLDDTGADWLFMVDTDMQWAPAALADLLRPADPVHAPIVGGLCFGTDGGRLYPTIFDSITLQNEDVIVRCDVYPHDRLVQVAATGAAFLLIHRDVLTAMRDAEFSAAFPWFQETERDGLPCGEDVTFCLRAGSLGYPVLVDTRVKVGHLKSVLLTEATYDAQEVG